MTSQTAPSSPAAHGGSTKTSFSALKWGIRLVDPCVTLPEASQYWIHTPPDGCGSNILTSLQNPALRRRSSSEPFRAFPACGSGAGYAAARAPLPLVLAPRTRASLRRRQRRHRERDRRQL